MVIIGRKGIYEDWLTEDGLLQIQGWARDGLTNEQIAHNIGVTGRAFTDWVRRFPSLSSALKKGKAPVDIEVENALLKRALTGDDLAFFLIEIHAFTIGDSKPAPQFRIIQQPNEFAKMVKEISKNTDLNESQTYRLEFWNMFNNVIEERGKPFNKHKPSTDPWYTVAIGSSKCHISIDLVNKENRIRISLWIPNNKELFDKYLVAVKRNVGTRPENALIKFRLFLGGNENEKEIKSN